MEISKGLQEEIILVQNQLKSAICDHQIYVGKLKDAPNNTNILSKIQEIQLHIVSLGQCQKQVVERLRKEVELYKADNANGAKVSLTGLLSLNNNNHITTNNSKAKKAEVKVHTNGIEVRNNYGKHYRNGPVNSEHKLCANARPSSVETMSIEDDDVQREKDVIEVFKEENSGKEQTENSEIKAQVDEDGSEMKQSNFLSILGLITPSEFTELQNKRSQRKRRRTANPQFAYCNWDVSTKRKKNSYLQSAESAPQTRQTTAKLNGPSPPPASAKPVTRPKSTTPPNKVAATKSVKTQQKATARPNILRTMQETKTFQNRVKLEVEEAREEASGKSLDNKALHALGLPTGLTIEKIENNPSVCTNCRNPGRLTMCEICSINYHGLCHPVSSPARRLCPKCVQRSEENEDRITPEIKKDEELAAASDASGVARKAGEDPEINKAASGLHKTDAAVSTQRDSPVSRQISQLPSSTLLIPITKSPHTSPDNQLSGSASKLALAAHITYTPLGVNTFSNQHQGITYIKSESALSGHNSAHLEHQYLVVKKLPAAAGENQPILPKNSTKKTKRNGAITQDHSDLAQSSPLLYDKLSQGTKKPLPDLNPIRPDVEPSAAESQSTSVSKPRSGHAAKSRRNNKPKCNKSVSSESTLSADSDPGDIHDPVLTVNNSTNTIASSIDQPTRNEAINQSTATVVDRLARRLFEDRAAAAYYRSRQSAAKLAQHVKLEEAHLSAPLAANLVQQRPDESLDRPRSCSNVEVIRCDFNRPNKPTILVTKERRNVNMLPSVQAFGKISTNVWQTLRQNNIIRGDGEVFDDSTCSASEGEKTDSLDNARDATIMSSIDMQVLEDFETAMRQINDEGETAN